MSKKLTSLLTLLLAFSLAAVAGDVPGKWTAKVPGRDGEMRDTTFNFKAEGTKLSGTMTGFQGREMEISDGRIEGDDLSFSVTIPRGGDPMKINYSGKVAGDEIQFKREGGPGPAREFTAKRAQ
jgi:hypothetical protein